MRGRTRVPAAVLPDKGQDISLDGFNLRINMVLGNTLVGTAILVCYSFPVRDFIVVGMPIAGHPPHRSRRAYFTHRAPTLGD